MGKVALSGAITATPEGSSAFPTATLSAALGLSQGTGKGFTAGTGILRRTISSPAAFITLEGTPATVAQANFLYARGDSPMQLRLTFDDGANPDIVSVVPLNGPLILEIPDAQFLKLFEVQGSGTIEYMLTGQ